MPSPRNVDMPVRSVSVIMATVVGLTFLFGFGNVLDLALRLGVPVWIAPLVAPALDLTVLGLLLATRHLALTGASPELLKPARCLLLLSREEDHGRMRCSSWLMRRCAVMGRCVRSRSYPWPVSISRATVAGMPRSRGVTEDGEGGSGGFRVRAFVRRQVRHSRTYRRPASRSRQRTDSRVWPANDSRGVNRSSATSPPRCGSDRVGESCDPDGARPGHPSSTGNFVRGPE